MPRQHRVAKTMPLQRFGGAEDIFQTKKKLQGCFSIFFFYMDENHI